MKRTAAQTNNGNGIQKRKVIVLTIIGLGVGLCVGYTFTKLAHWFMNLH